VSAPLDVVFVGHVDHGKSTLIARLLLDAGAFPDGKLSQLEEASRRRGVPLELSFLLDAFQVERDQAVTIDATRVWFRTPSRVYALCDAPGHHEFIKHMVTGASQAALAVLLIDAEQGVCEQTRHHAALLAMLGICDAVVAVNKMDCVAFSHERFAQIAQSATTMLEERALRAAAVIPTVARDGDNVVLRSQRMPWYDGATAMDALKSYDTAHRGAQPLRLPVQDVYRRGGSRVIVGNLQGGPLRPGDRMLFAPSGVTATVERFWDGHDTSALDGDAVAFSLEESLFIDAGSVGAPPEDAPAITDVFEASIFWFSPQELRVDSHLKMRLGTSEVSVRVEAIGGVLDVATYQYAPAEAVGVNGIAQVRLRCAVPVAIDVRPSSVISRFALYTNGRICGGGRVRTAATQRALRRRSPNVTPESHLVDRFARAARNGHRGGVLWLTGLPCAGKSTIAKELEQRLFAHGWNAYVLDGDTLRTGINGDLGFSEEDRRENVRRTAEMAALFADAGMIAIVALVSPSAADRRRAREVCPEAFHEIYVSTPRHVCEMRDVKGLYAGARRTKISGFTGVSAPYERPISPDLTIDATLPIDVCVQDIFDYVLERFER